MVSTGQNIMIVEERKHAGKLKKKKQARLEEREKEKKGECKSLEGKSNERSRETEKRKYATLLLIRLTDINTRDCNRLEAYP